MYCMLSMYNQLYNGILAHVLQLVMVVKVHINLHNTTH